MSISILPPDNAGEISPVSMPEPEPVAEAPTYTPGKIHQAANHLKQLMQQHPVVMSLEGRAVGVTTPATVAVQDADLERIERNLKALIDEYHNRDENYGQNLWNVIQALSSKAQSNPHPGTIDQLQRLSNGAYLLAKLVSGKTAFGELQEFVINNFGVVSTHPGAWKLFAKAKMKYGIHLLQEGIYTQTDCQKWLQSKGLELFPKKPPEPSVEVEQEESPSSPTTPLKYPQSPLDPKKLSLIIDSGGPSIEIVGISSCSRAARIALILGLLALAGVLVAKFVGHVSYPGWK